MAFKKTSMTLNLGADLDLVDGTPASKTVSLPLSSLDREIFVVTDIQMDTEALSVPAAPGTSILLAGVNKTSTNVEGINNPNCLGNIRRDVQSTAFSSVFQESFYPQESSTGTMDDYIGIIATPNFVLAGSFSTTAGGAANRKVYCRITGYRAKADADTYAALVTEEINQ
jgi:hypothetical protein